MVKYNKSAELLDRIIQLMTQFSRADFEDLRDAISQNTADKQSPNSGIRFEVSEKDAGKVDVIGKLPFVLLDKKYFPNSSSCTLSPTQLVLMSQVVTRPETSC